MELLGHCLEVFWLLPGTRRACLATNWNPLGQPFESCQTTARLLPACCSRAAWQLHAGCLKTAVDVARPLPGRRLETALLRNCLRTARGLLGNCLATAWRLPGNGPETAWKLLGGRRALWSVRLEPRCIAARARARARARFCQRPAFRLRVDHCLCACARARVCASARASWQKISHHSRLSPFWLKAVLRRQTLTSPPGR